MFFKRFLLMSIFTSSSLTLKSFAENTVCNRHPTIVRNLESITGKKCVEIDNLDLQKIKGLSIIAIGKESVDISLTDFDGLTNINTLYVSSSSSNVKAKVAAFPKEIFVELKKLQYLHFKNLIWENPESFTLLLSQLPKTTESLKISGTNLETFPIQYGNSSISLRYLYLSSNELLSNLEIRNFSSFPFLSSFSLIGTGRMNKLPNNLFDSCHSLYKVKIEGNGDEGHPIELTDGLFAKNLNLKYLELRFLIIDSTFNNILKELKSLYELSFWQTNLSEIRNYDFINYSDLKVLNLATYWDYPLTLNSDSFKGLENLQVLRLSRGDLEIIYPKGLFTTLKSLLRISLKKPKDPLEAKRVTAEILASSPDAKIEWV